MEWRKMFLRVPDKVIWAELPEKPLQSVPDKEASKWKTYAGDSDMFKGPWFLKLNCFKYLQCTGCESTLLWAGSFPL